MKIEDALSGLEASLNQDLSRVQELVLRQVWEGKTYAEIADQAGYNPDYIKAVGSHLWRWLSEALGEPVSKRNLRAVVYRNLNKRCEQQVDLQQDWDHAIDTSGFIGRSHELSALETWIVQERCRVVSIFGMSGVGKTALVARCAKQMQPEFDRLIRRSVRAMPIQILLLDLLQSLSGSPAAPNSPLEDLLMQLIGHLRRQRCLLILDHWETVLTKPLVDSAQPVVLSLRGANSDRKGYSQLLHWLAEEQHQSCLLLISDEKPADLSRWEGSGAPVRSLLLQGLNRAEARQLFAAAGIVVDDAPLHELLSRYSGNPFALKTIATVIHDLFNGDVTQFLQQKTPIINEIASLLEQQLRQLSRLEWQILNHLAAYPKGLSLGRLQHLMQDATAATLLEALRTLQRRSLLEIQSGQLLLPRLILEYWSNAANLEGLPTPPPAVPVTAIAPLARRAAPSAASPAAAAWLPPSYGLHVAQWQS